MFVSRLDRPWIETPFLFQGFLIKSRSEIDELQRWCEYVYVEADKGAAPRPEAKTERAPESRRRGLRGLIGSFRPASPQTDAEPEASPQPEPGTHYVNTADLKTEAPRAREAYTNASSALVSTMEKLRAGGTLDVHLLESAVSPMIESLLRNGDALTWLSRLKQTDDYTYGHSVSCAIYAAAFGRHLGLPREDLEVLGLGGLLLDVGKTRIPKALLSKPGRLTPEEMAQMRGHAAYGEAIVRDQPKADPRVLAMVRSHHERYDGSGYPDGTAGMDIPVFARLAGIVDFYDALITPRPYARAVSAFDAMRELNRRANREFQSEMIEQFIQAVGMFPNGALVELSDGTVGIVIEQNPVRRLRPKLVRILDAGKSALPEPSMLDLRGYPAEPDDPEALWIDRGLEVGAYGIESGDYFL